MNAGIFTVIGGGSAYTPGLMSALLHWSRAPGPEKLRLSEVRLYDIDQPRLGIVARLCARMAETQGGPFPVRAFTDLNQAVTGADAILNTCRPGGFEARRLDETLPLEFGVPGQETVGPGGFFFALRSVPEALRLLDAAERLASPGAVLLNYTNPTNIVTQALVARARRVRVLGLCDQSDEDMEALRLALGAGGESAAIRFRCVGLNHATWYHDLRGASGAPLPQPFPADLEPPDAFDEEHAVRFRLSSRIASQAPGYWPNSYLAYYQDPRIFVRLSCENGPRTDRIVGELGSYYAHFEAEAAKPVPDLRHHRGTRGFGDMAVKTLMALASDRETPLVLNMAPQGIAVPFSAGTVCELLAFVKKDGIRWDEAPEPPPGSRNLLERLEEYQLASAQAASAGRGLAEALALNPLVAQGSVARKMLDRARIAYGPLIGALQ